MPHSYKPYTNETFNQIVSHKYGCSQNNSVNAQPLSTHEAQARDQIPLCGGSHESCVVASAHVTWRRRAKSFFPRDMAPYGEHMCLVFTMEKAPCYCTLGALLVQIAADSTVIMTH